MGGGAGTGARGGAGLGAGQEGGQAGPVRLRLLRVRAAGHGCAPARAATHTDTAPAPAPWGWPAAPCCACGIMPRFSDRPSSAVLALPLRQPSSGRGPTNPSDGRAQRRHGVQNHVHNDLCHLSCRIQDVRTLFVGSDRALRILVR